MVAAVDPSPPPLSDDQVAILNAFIASNFDLAATAESAGITLLHLLTWHRAPAVQAALADLESLQARADELQLAAARRDAVKELHGILRDADSDPVERRRAATALLRRGTGGPPVSGWRGQPPPIAGAAHNTPKRSSVSSSAISRAIATLEANIDALARATPAPAASDEADQPSFIAEDAPARPHTADTQPPTSSEISNLKSAISSSSPTSSHDPEVPWMPGPEEDPFLTGEAAPLPHLAPYFAELQARRKSAANNSG
jgi:hypothetical protein